VVLLFFCYNIFFLAGIATYVKKLTLGISIHRLIDDITKRSKFKDKVARREWVVSNVLPGVGEYLV
jgi:hypothetical protein